MMRMLEAGGLLLLTDGSRPADEDNPDGYFEFVPVRHTARDTSWVTSARGRVVKVIYALLSHLPPDEEYRVVLLERDLGEVVDSQHAMLERSADEGAALSRDELITGYNRQLNQLQDWLVDQSNFMFTTVSYNELLINPLAQLARVSRLLERTLDTEAMCNAINPAFYRQRAGTV